MLVAEEARRTTGPGMRMNEDANCSWDFGGLTGGSDENYCVQAGTG